MAGIHRTEILRGFGGSVMFLAVELAAAKLSDLYGWPLVALVALLGLAPLAIGWWPEIKGWRRRLHGHASEPAYVLTPIGSREAREPDPPPSPPLAKEQKSQPTRVNVKLPEDGRIFVEGSVTPAYLASLYKPPNTSLSGDKLALPFLGKWIAVDGPFGDLNRKPAVYGGKLQDDILHVNFAFETKRWMEQGGDYPIITMYFDPQLWLDRLSIIACGDHIFVIGKIDDVRSFGITLSECELLKATAS